jgi:WhiB family redox-sensing transcriptional regulator
MSEKPYWHVRAACRESDPELFFPEGTAGPALETAAQAKRICAACPVRAQCLDWALSHRAEFGVWGGLTEQERRAARSTPPQRRLKQEGAPGRSSLG